MAENLPINFPIPAASSIASYNYADITEGTGVIDFNGFAHKELTVVGYGLMTGTIYASPTFTTAVVPNDIVYIKCIDKDFDVVFNMPKRLKGKIRINLTVGGGNL